MSTLAIFLSQFALSVLVVSLLARWYIWPWVNNQSFNNAVLPLLFPHAIRHLGLVFLVPGLVNQPLPNYFASWAAYGDLASGLLAIVAMFAVRNSWRTAIPILWVFSIVGISDLLNALSKAEVVPDLGTTWYIPTFWVPILLVTHVLIVLKLWGEGKSAHAGDTA